MLLTYLLTLPCAQVLNQTSLEAHPNPNPNPTPNPNQVLNQTSSEAHKFKLTALFLNRESDKAFFGGWIFRKAMDSKEKDMGKGDGWGASFRKVAGDRERRGRSRKASAKGGGRLRKVAKANKGG